MMTDFSFQNPVLSTVPLRITSRNSIFDRLSLAGVACGLVIGATVAFAQPDTARTLKLLEKRKEQQTQTAKQFKAFYGFQFTDRVKESGIRFENHIVDDAGKNYKPAH